MADPTKEEIREWLRENGKNREWLADQCGVHKTTVNNWFSNRPIPGSSLATIRILMDQKPTAAEAGLIQFSANEYERIESARLFAGYADRPSFYRAAVLQLVEEIELEEKQAAKTLPFPAQASKAAEDAAAYVARDLRTADVLFAGIDLGEFARAAVVPLSVIRQFLRGEQPLDAEALKRVSAALKEPRDRERLRVLNDELLAGHGHRRDNPGGATTEEGTGDGLPVPTP